MLEANGKTTTLQLFLDSLSPKYMLYASSGDNLKIALFGDLSLEEAMDLFRDRQILELEPVHSPFVTPYLRCWNVLNRPRLKLNLESINIILTNNQPVESSVFWV
jgi:hypothetical protein